VHPALILQKTSRHLLAWLGIVYLAVRQQRHFALTCPNSLNKPSGFAGQTSKARIEHQSLAKPRRITASTPTPMPPARRKDIAA